MNNKKVFMIVVVLSLVAFAILIVSFIRSQKRPSAIDKIISEMPVYNNLNDSFEKINRYDPNKALAAIPDKAVRHYVSGKKFYIEKNFTAAQSAFNKSINIFESAEVYCALALCYMEQNNFGIAIEKLNKSVALDPIYPKAEYALAVSYAQMLPPNVEEAKKHCEKAKELGYNIPDWFVGYLAKIEKE